MDTATASRSTTVTAFDVRRRRQLEVHRRIVDDAKPVLLAALDGFGTSDGWQDATRQERIQRAFYLLKQAENEVPGQWKDGVDYLHEALVQVLMAHAVTRLASTDHARDDDHYPTL